MGNESPFYTTKQAAHVLGVHPRTLNRYLQKKGSKIPVIRITKKVLRIPKDAFHRWAMLDGESSNV